MSQEMVEIEPELAEQIVSVLKYDAESGYRNNKQPYADIRHGSARAIAEKLDVGWKEIPSVYSGRDLRDEIKEKQ